MSAWPSERTAVVTGAGSERGIGRALADRLAREGWAVAVLDVDGDGVRAAASRSRRATARGPWGSPPTSPTWGRGRRAQPGWRPVCRPIVSPRQPGRHLLPDALPRGRAGGVGPGTWRSTCGGPTLRHPARRARHGRPGARTGRQRLLHLRPARRQHVLEGSPTARRRPGSSASRGPWRASSARTG